MSEQRAVPEIPEDLANCHSAATDDSTWGGRRIRTLIERIAQDRDWYLGQIKIVNEANATLTVERDSAKRELAEIEANAKAERKKYEALRLERDALKADVSEEEVIAIVGPDTHPGDVTFRLGAWQVAQEIINARTRPSEKEETAMRDKRAELTKFEELMLNSPQFREAYMTHSDSELSAAWELIADLKAQVERLSSPPSDADGWLIERGGLCIGMECNTVAWVTFTHPQAIRFSRKQDAENMLTSLRSFGHWTAFHDCIVTGHTWLAARATPPAKEPKQ